MVVTAGRHLYGGRRPSLLLSSKIGSAVPKRGWSIILQCTRQLTGRSQQDDWTGKQKEQDEEAKAPAEHLWQRTRRFAHSVMRYEVGFPYRSGLITSRRVHMASPRVEARPWWLESDSPVERLASSVILS